MPVRGGGLGEGVWGDAVLKAADWTRRNVLGSPGGLPLVGAGHGQCFAVLSVVLGVPNGWIARSTWSSGFLLFQRTDAALHERKNCCCFCMPILLMMKFYICRD
ncbi:hypothetical protein Dimus_024618 [Dionaea muscipula]